MLDTIPATGRYLDTYFRANLEDDSSPGWHRILLPPRRCLVPFEDDDSSVIQCKVRAAMPHRVEPPCLPP